MGGGRYQGVDEVLEVDGSTPSSGDGPQQQHQPQSELGPAQKHSGSGYSRAEVSGMSAWGRLQPHELKPLVLGQENAAALAAAQHGTGAGAAAGVSHAGQDDEMGRRTVLGAIVGAVLGSAAVGAGLAMVLAAALRRRRARQQQAGRGCLNSCVSAEIGRGQVGAARLADRVVLLVECWQNG